MKETIHCIGNLAAQNESGLKDEYFIHTLAIHTLANFVAVTILLYSSLSEREKIVMLPLVFETTSILN